MLFTILIGLLISATRISTAVLCNQSNAQDDASNFVINLRDEIAQEITNPNSKNGNNTNDMLPRAGCAESIVESTLLCGAACCASCEELDCDDLMYDFNCISWERARIFKPLGSKYDNTTLLNIAKSFANHCGQLTSFLTWLYYADINGIMITYPYYVTATDNDCTDEDDQCTEERVLSDPRIKSWYVSTVTVPKVVILVAHLTNPNMKSLMTLTSLLLIETLSDSDYIMVYVSDVSCTNLIVSATLSQRLIIKNCIVNNLNVTSVDINVKSLCQEFDRRLMMSTPNNYGILIMLLVDHDNSRVVIECNDTSKLANISIIMLRNNSLKVNELFYIVTDLTSAVEAVKKYYKDYINYTNSNDTTKTLPRDDNNCMYHWTTCTKLITNNTLKGVICVDHTNNSMKKEICTESNGKWFNKIIGNLISEISNDSTQCSIMTTIPANHTVTNYSVTIPIIICLIILCVVTTIILCCMLWYRKRRRKRRHCGSMTMAESSPMIIGDDDNDDENNSNDSTDGTTADGTIS